MYLRRLSFLEIIWIGLKVYSFCILVYKSHWELTLHYHCMRKTVLDSEWKQSVSSVRERWPCFVRAGCTDIVHLVLMVISGSITFLSWSFSSRATVCIEFVLFMPWRPWLQNYIKHCALKIHTVFELKSYIFLPDLYGRKEINYIESSTFLCGSWSILFLWGFFLKNIEEHYFIIPSFRKNKWKFTWLNFLFQIMGHRMWCMFTSIRRPWGIGALYSIW